MKYPVKRRVLFQKDMLENCCAVVTSYWWHMVKIITLLRKLSCHTTQNMEISIKSWVVKEEETFRIKYSADTPTDTAFVDFGCASSSSQWKKDGVIEVDGFGEIFVKFSFNKFRINEAKICLNCKETHFNWFF